MVQCLALDTSTMVHSVAVLDGDSLLSERSVRANRGHSSRLLGSVDGCLRDAGLTLEDLDLLVVGAGPGSFVGLRIGLALAKGFAVKTGQPVVMASSLAALARAAAATEGLVVPALDARKNEMYTGLYRFDAERPVEVVPDRTATAQTLARLILDAAEPGEPITLLGPGLRAYGDALGNALGPVRSRVLRLDATFESPRASHLAMLALESFDPDQVPTLATLEPNYQRLSEAEIAWNARQ